MPIRWTKRFARNWKILPPEIKSKAGRVALLIDSNRQHPSLRVKRLQSHSGYWELRVDDDWRIILKIEGNVFIFVTIGRHDVLEKFN